MKKMHLLLISSSFILLPSVYAQTTTTTTSTTTSETQPAYTTVEPAPVPPLQIDAIYWYPEMSGHVKVADNSQSTEVNLRSDLGLNEHINVPGADAIFNLGPDNSIRASYLYLHDTGSNTLSRNVVYDGHTYFDGTPINSKMTTQYFSLGWLFNFLHLDDDRFSGGLVIDVKGISTRATVDSAAYGSQSEHFTGAAPTAGVSFKYKIIDPISIYAEGEGIPAGHYGYFFDAQGGLKWSLIQQLDLSAGYRVIKAKVDYSDSDSGEITFDGPYAALTLNF